MGRAQPPHLSNGSSRFKNTAGLAPTVSWFYLKKWQLFLLGKFHPHATACSKAAGSVWSWAHSVPLSAWAGFTGDLAKLVPDGVTGLLCLFSFSTSYAEVILLCGQKSGAFSSLWPVLLLMKLVMILLTLWRLLGGLDATLKTVD